VLDDLTDPVDQTGLCGGSDPPGGGLVITRPRDIALATPNRQVVDVGLFTSDEANAYLTPDQLAAQLGFLPLA
jgi:hypothetical protein